MKKKILFFTTAVLLGVASAFAQIVDGGTTGPLTWQLTGTAGNYTLTISGVGNMPDYWSGDPSPWYGYRESITNVVVEDGVGSIGNNAFPNCYILNSITIPNSVITIGAGAFSLCSTINSIAIPNSVISIGNSAFMHCSALNSINIPNSISIIENGTFWGTALASIIIPSSVTAIENYAFYDCTALTSITVSAIFPPTLGEMVFHNVSTSIPVNIPSGTLNSYLTSSWHNYFSNFIEFQIGGTTGPLTWELKDGVLTISGTGAMPDYGAWASPWNDYREFITSIVIGNNVTSIGNHAFFDCQALISIIIPNNVATIGGDAFSNCSSLTSVTLPNSITAIASWTFNFCSSLTSITIPSSVINIGSCAFRHCSALKSITNLNPEPVKINENVFEYVNISACTLKVPHNSVSDYQEEEVWKYFNIVCVDAYLVSVSVNNEEYGTATGGGYYDVNETVTLTATAYPNYKFINWTKDGEIISTENPYSFTVTEDVEFVANFEEEVGIEKFALPTLNIFPNPTTGELRIINYKLRIGSVEIFDVYGRKYEDTKARKLEEEWCLNISDLPPGIYFVKIQTETGTVVRKVVKK